MSRVHLVRHGSHGLLGKILAGRMPGVALSDRGRHEAARLAARLAGAEIHGILSSPLGRCRETAAPIAEQLGLPVSVEPSLNEIDCGEWTGQSFEALAADERWRLWNEERQHHAIPGGESVEAVKDRVGGLLADLARHDGSATILVSHGDVIKVAVLAVIGAPIGLHDRIEVDPASITTLDLWPGGGKVVRLNEVVA